MNLFYNSYSRILNTLIPVLIVANVVVYVFCFMFYVFMLLVLLVPFAKILYNKIVFKINPAHPALLLLSLSMASFFPLALSFSFLHTSKNSKFITKKKSKELYAIVARVVHLIIVVVI